MIKVCRNCGALVNHDDVVCHNCGKLISDKFVVIEFLMYIVIGIISVLGLVFSRKKENNPSKKTNQIDKEYTKNILNVFGKEILVTGVVVIILIAVVVLASEIKWKIEKEERQSAIALNTSIDVTTASDTHNDSSNALNEFYRKVNGVWVLTEGPYMEYVDKNAFIFCTFYDDDKMNTGVYPGSYDNEGEISAVSLISEDWYEMTIYYPETHDYTSNSTIPEEWVTFKVRSDDGFEESMVISVPRVGTNVYTYGGETLDEAISRFSN